MREYDNPIKSTFNTEVDSFKYQEAKLAEEIEKSNKELMSVIDKSSIKDERIRVLLQHKLKNVNNARLTAKLDTAMKAVQSQIKMTDAEAKMFADVNDRIKEYKKDQAQYEKTKRMASGFSLENLYKSYKSGGARETMAYAGEKTREALTMRNMTKGLMHVAGVMTDAPIFNILASDMKGSLRGDDAKEFMAIENDLKSLNTSKQSGKVSSSQETIEVKGQDVVTDQLKELVDVSLESAVYLETIDKRLDEFLYMQRDMADDVKQTKKAPVEYLSSEKKAMPEEQPNMFDDFDMFGRRGRRGKGGKLGKMFSGGKGLLKSGASLLGKAALPLAALMAGFDAFQGVKQSEQIFGLGEGQKSTTSQNISAGVGSAISGLTFGMLDTKDIANTLDAIGGKGGGLLRGLTTDKKALGIAEQLEQAGVVDLSMIGDSQIRDLDAIRKLTKDQVDSLIKYDDWDTQTLEQLKAISKAKDEAVGAITSPSIPLTSVATPSMNKSVQQMQNVVEKPLDEAKIASAVSAGMSSSQTVVPVPVGQKENKMAMYPLESRDLVEVLRLYGMGV